MTRATYFDNRVVYRVSFNVGDKPKWHVKDYKEGDNLSLQGPLYFVVICSINQTVLSSRLRNETFYCVSLAKTNYLVKI